MPIPTWCLVLGAILLFIGFILSIKIKLVLAYEESFAIYIKILFFKIMLFPDDKKKKTKKKKKKSSSTTTKKEKTSNEPKKKISASQIIKIISVMKDTVIDILKDFFGKIHFKFIKIHADIGCEDASKTALAYGAVTQGVAYFIELLDNTSNVEVSSSSSIDIRANFISQKSWLELNCLLYIRVISLISLGIKALKGYLKYKNIQEKLLEVENDGTIKTK